MCGLKAESNTEEFILCYGDSAGQILAFRIQSTRDQILARNQNSKVGEFRSKPELSMIDSLGRTLQGSVPVCRARRFRAL